MTQISANLYFFSLFDKLLAHFFVENNKKDTIIIKCDEKSSFMNNQYE